MNKFAVAPFFASGTHSRSYTAATAPLSAIASEPIFRLPSFTLFPNLPLEIRLQIWCLIAALPRVISIYTSTTFGPPAWKSYTHDPGREDKWIPKARPPLTLMINHESRAETLSNYHLCFRTQLIEQIYFSPSSDVLLFLDVISMEAFFKKHWISPQDKDRKLVRQLAFISEEKGLDTFSLWLQERTVARQLEIYENLQQMAYVNIDGVKPTEVMLEKLREDDGVVSKAFVGQKEDYGETPSVVYVKLEENPGPQKTRVHIEIPKWCMAERTDSF